MKRSIICVLFLVVMPTTALADTIWDCSISLTVELDTLTNRYNPSGKKPTKPLAVSKFSKKYVLRADSYYLSPDLDINLSFLDKLYRNKPTGNELVEHRGDKRFLAILQDGLNLDYNKELNSRIIVRANQIHITNIDILSAYGIDHQASTSSHSEYTNTNVAHEVTPYTAVTVWRKDTELGKRGEIYQIFPEVLVSCEIR